jgi:imidazoleglycerol-phosphate dehydratase
MSRTATIERNTAETHVRLALTLEGTGAGTRATGVGFLDHMLDLLARHGRLDLDVSVTGDLQTRASCAVDVSGRPFTLFEAELPPGATGGFEHELTEEFFRALANAAKLTLHLRVETGSNAHHMIEAAFKAFARALRQAVAIDPTEPGVPSTKGTLTA